MRTEEQKIKHRQSQQRYREKLRKEGKLAEYRKRGRNPEQSKRWRARKGNSFKHLAHHEVYKAKLKGDITPEACEYCGSTEFIAAHHDDYSKPLEVRWLCQVHHSYVHRNLVSS